MGCNASLEGLLNALGIPNEAHTFHCAGNDAHYTMQVLLALLVRREERAGNQAEHTAFQHFKELAWAKAPTKREVRDRLDEEAERCNAEEFDWFGCMFDDAADGRADHR